jgi:hypothetical protein
MNLLFSSFTYGGSAKLTHFPRNFAHEKAALQAANRWEMSAPSRYAD